MQSVFNNSLSFTEKKTVFPSNFVVTTLVMIIDSIVFWKFLSNEDLA